MVTPSETFTRPLRERNKVSRRLRIEKAAFSLMTAEGFSGTTIEQIAAAADVSKSTFLRYFPTKEAVVFNTSEEDFAAIRSAIASRGSSTNVLNDLQRAISEVSRYFDRRRDLLLARYEIESQNPELEPYRLLLQRKWETVILEGLLERPQSDPRVARILAALARSVLTSAVDEWRSTGAESPLEEIVAAYFSAFRRTAEAGPRK